MHKKKGAALHLFSNMAFFLVKILLEQISLAKIIGEIFVSFPKRNKHNENKTKSKSTNGMDKFEPTFIDLTFQCYCGILIF